MKKIVILIVIVLFTFSVNAQKKPKIKGNKIVADFYNNLEDFSAIEVGDNLKVNISQTVNNGYHLRTDENLVDVVKFDIVNGVLTIYTTHNITRSKELEINLTFKEISSITLKDDAKLSSINKLMFTDFSFFAFDNTSYELDLKVDDAIFNLSKSTSGKIQLNGNKAIMNFKENAFLKGDVAMDELEINMNDRTDINLSGDVNNLKIKSTGSATLKGKDLKASYTELNSSNSSNIYVYTSKELKIYAKDKSSIYVYGKPEIIVDGLNDKSQIVKK